MNTAIRQTINHWGHLLPYTHIPHNENEYNKLLNFVDELMEISRHKKDERVTSLLRLPYMEDLLIIAECFLTGGSSMEILLGNSDITFLIYQKSLTFLIKP